MELFRPAGLLQADPDSRDWTRDHGYAQVSSFPFPPLYLGCLLYTSDAADE